ncbi:prepilin-type N-terminal cleavage/methylation domain-containing protein [bacterium]|nr:prepilin-type N-terminal cleavage/methylation domain-containing protein [bacterium]MBU1754263.1 prepilin-type N-terminal cleavage/methylation domain-containing protein [bacterium]
MERLRLSEINNGFILLEVMIALAILSSGLILILSSFSVSLMAVRNCEDYTRAAFLLQEKISELEENPSTGSLDGGFEDEEGFRWKAGIKDAGGLGLKEIKVTVEWKNGTAEIQTLMVSP